MTAFARAPDAHFEVVEGRALILDPTGKEMVTLNPVGTLVWEALEGPLDVDGLVERVLPQVTGVGRDDLERDVRTFVDELVSSALIIEVSTP